MSSGYNDLIRNKKPNEVEVSYAEYREWFDSKKKKPAASQEEPDTSVSEEPRAKTREEEIEE